MPAKEKNIYQRNESGTRLIRSGARSKSRAEVKRRGRQSRQRVEEEEDEDEQEYFSKKLEFDGQETGVEKKDRKNRSSSNYSVSRQRENMRLEKRATEFSSNHQHEDSRSVSRVSRVSKVSQAYKESFVTSQHNNDQDYIHRTRSYTSFIQS